MLQVATLLFRETIVNKTNYIVTENRNTHTSFCVYRRSYLLWSPVIINDWRGNEKALLQMWHLLREALLDTYMSGGRFFVFKFWVQNQETHTTKSSTKWFKGWIDTTNRACSDADPGFVCPTAAIAAAVCCWKNSIMSCIISSSSGCTCYEKLSLLLLEKTCQIDRSDADFSCSN